MSEPDKNEFDLFAAITGRAYPEASVDIYLDEAKGLRVAELNARLDQLSALGLTDEYNSVEAEFEALIDELREDRIRVNLKGVPVRVKKDILRKVSSENPPTRDAFGREQYGPEAEDALDLLSLQAHVTTIENADGEGKAPSEEELKALLDYAPTSAIKQIMQAIQGLEKSSEGFEIASRGADFLSKSSQKD